MKSLMGLKQGQRVEVTHKNGTGLGEVHRTPWIRDDGTECVYVRLDDGRQPIRVTDPNKVVRTRKKKPVPVRPKPMTQEERKAEQRVSLARVVPKGSARNRKATRAIKPLRDEVHDATGPR